jgi:hypothetical protein
MEKILEHIKTDFNGKVTFQQKRPGIYQLYLPLYHEDGDMIDIYLRKNGNRYELCDFGQTLMRLSYSYEIDTPTKEGILQKILSENRLIEDDGNIILETSNSTAFTDLMHISQAYAKIGSMRYFKRETIESLFFENLDEFVFAELGEFLPQKKTLPIPDRVDLEADYQFSPNGHPVFLFGVKDALKARLATITCLEYQKSNLKFTSLIVHEDFDKLSKRDRAMLTNNCDKQFTSLNEFKTQGKKFLERERK